MQDNSKREKIFSLFVWIYAMAASNAIFIMSVNDCSLCSGVVSSGETNESEIVTIHAACFPNTLAFENNAKLSISTARQPFSSTVFK